MRLFRRLLPATLVALTLVATVAIEPASATDTGVEELVFVAKLNELRVSRGLAPLATKGALFDMARAWAGNMEAAGGISHNPSLAAQGPAGWRRLGENVGMGYDVQGLHDAFVASPLHFQNMVDPAFDSVGVGVVHAADGKIFVTVNFMTSPAPAPAAAKPRRVCTRTRRNRTVCRTR
ncbi:MAG TPA: CAP domain-containing protein [Acidimicrobiales bacterium]|nr:CAP domain-containing protein [Acidimicrobiales bacterium]